MYRDAQCDVNDTSSCTIKHTQVYVLFCGAVNVFISEMLNPFTTVVMLSICIIPS
jgi:hypothetical protein